PDSQRLRSTSAQRREQNGRKRCSAALPQIGQRLVVVGTAGSDKILKLSLRNAHQAYSAAAQYREYSPYSNCGARNPSPKVAALERWCGGSDVPISLAATSSSERPNQNRTTP